MLHLLRKVLYQPFQLFLIQVLHDLPDILRAVAGCDEQRILGLHDDQVANPYRRHELPFGMNEVSPGIGDEALPVPPEFLCS